MLSKYIKIFLISFLLMVSIDLIYLTINKKLYSSIITVTRLQFAPIAWAFMAFSLTYFILSDDTLAESQKIFRAMILGLSIYGIYNFTNLTILQPYNLNITITDTIWGTFLYGFITFIVLLLNNTYKLY
jgi:uncharacterized membrane protein